MTVPTLTDWLREYTTKGAYPAVWFLPVACECGFERFRLARADGNVRRTCARCDAERYVSRSGSSGNWDEAVGAGEAVEEFACAECGAKQAYICMGFAELREARRPKRERRTASGRDLMVLRRCPL